MNTCRNKYRLYTFISIRQLFNLFDHDIHVSVQMCHRHICIKLMGDCGQCQCLVSWMSHVPVCQQLSLSSTLSHCSWIYHTFLLCATMSMPARCRGNVSPLPWRRFHGDTTYALALSTSMMTGVPALNAYSAFPLTARFTITPGGTHRNYVTTTQTYVNKFWPIMNITLHI